MIHNTGRTPGTRNPKERKFKDHVVLWGKRVGLIVVCLLAFMHLWSVFPNKYKCFFVGGCPPPEKITIGILTLDKEKQLPDLQALADYLSKQSDYKFEIDPVLISDPNSLKQAKENLEEKTRKWDIAFTSEPFTSLEAIDAGYPFVARMSPLASTIQTAVISKKTLSKSSSTPIKSLQDFSSTTTLAIGYQTNKFRFKQKQVSANCQKYQH